jgi:hypothetical protein
VREPPQPRGPQSDDANHHVRFCHSQDIYVRYSRRHGRQRSAAAVDKLACTSAALQPPRARTHTEVPREIFLRPESITFCCSDESRKRKAKDLGSTGEINPYSVGKRNQQENERVQDPNDQSVSCFTISTSANPVTRWPHSCQDATPSRDRLDQGNFKIKPVSIRLLLLTFLGQVKMEVAPRPAAAARGLQWSKCVGVDAFITALLAGCLSRCTGQVYPVCRLPAASSIVSLTATVH